MFANRRLRVCLCECMCVCVYMCVSVLVFVFVCVCELIVFVFCLYVTFNECNTSLALLGDRPVVGSCFNVTSNSSLSVYLEK